MKAIKRGVLLLLFVGVTNANPDPTTNEPSSMGLLMDARLQDMPIEQTKPDDDFWTRFSTRSRNKFEERFFYRANPFLFKLHELSVTDPNAFLVDRGYITTAVKYSAREIFVDTAIVQDSQDWFRTFVEGVVGNTDEEEMTIMEKPSLQYSEESWRQKVKSDRFKWGVRLLRWPNQYVYVSGKMGHLDGEEILQWHLRYHVYEFKSQRVEALLSMPLPESFSVSLGLSYSPSQKYWELGRVYAGTLCLERWASDMSGAFFFALDVAKQQYLTVGYFAAF